MTQVDCRKFDFRKSGFIDPAIARLIKLWMGKTAQLFLKRWEEMAPEPVKMRAEAPFTQSFETLIDGLAELATGCVISVGPEKMASVLTVNQPGIQALISQILCDPLETMPEPRELTSIEVELAELLFDGIASAASEAWPQKDPLPIESGRVESQPGKLRLFGGNEFMIVAPLAVESSAGTVVFEWSVPRAGLAKLLAPLVGSTPAQKSATASPLDGVLRIPLDIRVTLGTADLAMTELCQLGVGDVIVLNQSISDPLSATIGGERVFVGWPGRVGNIQALKVSEGI